MATGLIVILLIADVVCSLLLCYRLFQMEGRVDFFERLIGQARRESQAANGIANETQRMITSVLNGADARVDQRKLLEYRMRYRAAVLDDPRMRESEQDGKGNSNRLDGGLDGRGT